MTTENTRTDDGDKAVRDRRPSLIAWQVRDGKDNESSYWDRVGVAWQNRDGGYTVQLHSMPLSGRIVLRKPEKRD
jgi:hypothetical protein